MSETLFICKLEVREYNEEMDVELRYSVEKDRLVVRSYNEAGYNSTEIDLMDLLLAMKALDREKIEAAI